MLHLTLKNVRPTHIFQKQIVRCVSKIIEIRNIPRSLSYINLRNLVQEYGPVSYVRASENQARAEIKFYDLNPAISIVDELHQTVIHGNRISVTFSY